MNTIKIYLSESLSVADLRKDFPLYQGQYQSKLLNVFVPKNLLSVDYDVQHYIGKMTSVGLPSDETLDAFVITHTPTSREPQESDFIDVVATIDENIVLYRYTFTTEWTYEQVESFAINEMAGTSVKLGMVATAPNGQVVKSKSYYMRYLKDITYQNVEYALYERKLPKEFTAFSGVGENAPKMVINVVNISTDGFATINDIICSQTCSFEVLPSSILDRDESIQPSELETLTALVNELISAYDSKQNKNSNDLATTSKAIVGAINELKGQQDTNTVNISTAQGDISDLETAVAYIQEHYTTPETYIGQMTGDTLPSGQDLTEYVEIKTGRLPKNADVVIFVLQVSGGTDKNYKYTYSTTGWNGYEIPPMETASNGNAGIVEGTYNVGDTNNTLVDIVGGKIKEVYVNTKGTGSPVYMTLSQIIPTLFQDIDDIESGTTKVGYADKADKDGNGNDIATTYMTNVVGASKTYVKNYALPRTFNDIYYYTGNSSTSVYSKTNDNSLSHYDATIQLGYTSLLTATMTVDSTFQLSNKNSFENTFYLKDSSSSVGLSEHSLFIRIETSVSQDGGTTYTPINVEISNLITFANTTDLVKVQMGGTFDLLGEGVLNIQEGDLIKQVFSAYTESTSGISSVSIYWGSNYPLKFSLNTQQVVFSSGLLGQQPTFANASSSNETVTIDGVSTSVKMYYLPDAPQLNDGVEGLFVLTGNLQNVDLIGIRVGDSLTYEEFALKVPSNYFNSNKYITLSDINGLPIRRNDDNNDQIVFKGFIRNNNSTKYVLIDAGGEGIKTVTISSTSGTLTDEEYDRLKFDDSHIIYSGMVFSKFAEDSSKITFRTLYGGYSNTSIDYIEITKSTKAYAYQQWSLMVSENNIDSGSATAGKVLTADGSSYCSWEPIPAQEGTTIKSTGETIGKVLTADGSGGASWEYSSGGTNVSLTTTAGSEAITVGGDTLNVATRDTAQNISGAKTFTNGNIAIKNASAYNGTPTNATNSLVYFKDTNGSNLATVYATVGATWNALNFRLFNKSNVEKIIEFVHSSSSDSWNFDCTTDASINLGTDTRRWKDGWFSGTVNSQYFLSKNPNWARSESPVNASNEATNSWEARINFVDKNGNSTSDVSSGIGNSFNAIEVGVNDKDGNYKNVRLVASGLAGASHTYAFIPASADILLGNTSSTGKWKGVYAQTPVRIYGAEPHSELYMTNDEYNVAPTSDQVSQLITYDKNGQWWSAWKSYHTSSTNGNKNLMDLIARSPATDYYSGVRLEVDSGMTSNYQENKSRFYPYGNGKVYLGSSSNKWNEAYISKHVRVYDIVNTNQNSADYLKQTSVPNHDTMFTQDVYTTAPTKAYTGQYLARDKNGQYLGGMGVRHNTDGSIEAQLVCRSQNTNVDNFVCFYALQDATANTNAGKFYFLPNTNANISLGSPNHKWANFYLNGNISNSTYTWTMPDYTGTLGVIDGNTISATYMGTISSTALLSTVITSNGEYLLVPYGYNAYTSIYDNTTLKMETCSPVQLHRGTSTVRVGHPTSPVNEVAIEEITNTNCKVANCKVYKL